MEPRPGFTLKQLWADSEHAIAQKTQTSYEVQDTDIRRAVTAISAMPAATLPDSAFLAALGTPALLAIPPQTGSLAQRAIEEWERNLCENKAVAILERMQTGRPALIKKDGGEMLIAIVLDRPLAEAQALVDTPDAFIQALTTIIQDKEPPGHCPDDPAGHKRRGSTRGGYNEFLQKLQPTSRKSTPPHTFAYPIPIRTRGQREVLTVATH